VIYELRFGSAWCCSIL